MDAYVDNFKVSTGPWGGLSLTFQASEPHPNRTDLQRPTDIVNVRATMGFAALLAYRLRQIVMEHQRATGTGVPAIQLSLGALAQMGIPPEDWMRFWAPPESRQTP